MTVSEDHPVTSAINHLYKVLEGSVTLDTDMYLTPVTDILISLPKADIIPFIQPTVAVLSRPDIGDAYFIIPFLNNLVKKVSLNDVLKAISLDELITGILSPSEDLSIACLELVRRADSPDDAADPKLIQALLRSQLEDNTSIQATSILSGFLKKSEKIRYLVFGPNNTEILLDLKEESPAMLMELVEAALPAMDVEIDSTWLKYDIEDNDYTDVIQILHFYTVILANPHSRSLAQTLSDTFNSIFAIFIDKNYPDRVHVRNYIYSFFRSLSENDAEMFSFFDKKYSLMTDNPNDLGLLAHVCPSYLAAYSSIISGLALSSETLPAFENLIQCRSSYNLLDLDGRSIMRLSVTDGSKIIETLTKTEWGTQDLLTKWPQVMDFLVERYISDSHIRSTVIRSLENLLHSHRNMTENSIWAIRIRERIRSLMSANQTPQLEMAT